MNKFEASATFTEEMTVPASIANLEATSAIIFRLDSMMIAGQLFCHFDI